MKAHFRLAVCLYELDKLKDSKIYLDQFTMKYPSYKTSAAYKSLHSDLLNAQTNKDKFDGNYYTIIFVLICLVFCVKYLSFFSIVCVLDLGKKTRETLDTTSNVLDALHIEQAQKINVEKYFRNQAKDYDRRYYGHCNTSTDIKEANFFGR